MEDPAHSVRVIFDRERNGRTGYSEASSNSPRELLWTVQGRV
jgi:hypothetical protein